MEPPKDAKGSGTESGIQPQYGVPFGVTLNAFLSPFGLPCKQPAWGYISALDLKTNEVVWKKRIGTPQDSLPFPMPVKLPFTMGMPMLGGPISTAGNVLFIGATADNYLRAYNMSNGEKLWQARLPAGGQATPMTYALDDGRQMVVIVAGGHGSIGTKPGDYATYDGLNDADAVSRATQLHVIGPESRTQTPTQHTDDHHAIDPIQWRSLQTNDLEVTPLLGMSAKPLHHMSTPTGKLPRHGPESTGQTKIVCCQHACGYDRWYWRPEGDQILFLEFLPIHYLNPRAIAVSVGYGSQSYRLDRTALQSGSKYPGVFSKTPKQKAQTVVWALLCSGGTDGARTRDPLRDRQVF